MSSIRFIQQKASNATDFGMKGVRHHPMVAASFSVKGMHRPVLIPALQNRYYSASPAIKSSFSSTNRQRPIYVCATRQHVGKTSVSLALVSHFTKRFGSENVGYMKAVGQQCMRVWDKPLDNDESDDDDESGQYVLVDKDVKLIRDHFGLSHLRYQDMSPMLIPQGYTKSYLDGEIKHQDQMADIRRAYLNIVKATKLRGGNNNHSITICEGTGHVGVGSVVGSGNARVAAELGADAVLVANGGLGRSFDELELNRALCLQYGVKIAGVVINKVQPDKYEQTREYLTKAIEQMWTGPNGEPAPPILGVVPDRPYLGCPALADVESTFGTVLLSGSDHRYRHYDVGSNVQGRSIGMSMITTDLAAFLRTMQRQDGDARTMFICHVTRDDVILGFLAEYRRKTRRGIPFQSALVICTGGDDGMEDVSDMELTQEVCDMIRDAGPSGPPVILASGYSPADAAKVIRTMTPKFNANDNRRVTRATEHYEPYIDFDLLLDRTSSVTDMAA
jgi:dethiobiotin synthetase